MSEYGRLYEKVARIRADLKELQRVRRDMLGSLPSVPLIDTIRLSAARASAKILAGEIEALLMQWEQLEKEMEKCDDG